jgi:type III restriction enzyme
MAAADRVVGYCREISGKKTAKEARVAPARDLWVPAVNNHDSFGRWGLVGISDPWDAQRCIRASLPLAIRRR